VGGAEAGDRVQIRARVLLKNQTEDDRLIAEMTGHKAGEGEKDVERDYFHGRRGSAQYGIIDEILTTPGPQVKRRKPMTGQHEPPYPQA
jgi:ATP-dependent protease ClpP protease subunit